MKKHDKDLSAIIQAKANFLVSLQANLGQQIQERLEGFRQREIKIDAMPTRGVRQRERRIELYDQLDVDYDSFRKRIGSQIIHTFGFVLQHRKFLNAGTRKLLIGKEPV